MTQDEMIELAKQAGIKRRSDVFFSSYCDGIYFDDLVAFAKLIADKECEACAKVCDDYDVAEDVNSCDTAEGIAIAIRARGQA